MSSLDLRKGTFISIGTHRLLATVSGVDRSTDMGTFATILLYHRTGLGRSEDAPDPMIHRATTAAQELQILLTQAHLSPPYLVVGHSYGAIIAREFLHLCPQAVIGMVVADGSTERQPELLQDPDLDLAAVQGDLSFARVTGLRTNAQLTRDEWRARARDIARGRRTRAVEAGEMVEVCQTLGAKEQYRHQALGQKPLSVVRCRGSLDYRKIYEASVAAGNGSETQQKAFERLFERWDGVDQAMQEDQLQLSSQSRLVYLEGCGHHIHLLRPEVIAEEVR
ncbi:alpha/beta fold hydrolase [Aspergillus saccharolyticus JOP 1030-1]|uniref:Alpha/beta hydrolase fold protein n=1 Tax=Aspergillus saccharolyticus JOP 1030-1 TaxID=1450539 RepID=A0A318ZU93_9EURO|nr:alpha/beta hydrolase fold protein [Aspergillus saccharolyticus JOP 1030-1]PYH47893.1 alpha/beta hydrolase fold protein [Aspergillus saccharolyticus JOP 1030-1]